MATITVSTDKLLSTVTYAAGDTITITAGATLTIAATPTVRPGTIQCLSKGKLRVENTGTSLLTLTTNIITNDLIFSGNGVLEVRGQMVTAYTGTGAANQSFVVLPRYPTYVEVETAAASNVFVPWYVVPKTATGSIVYNFANHAAICAAGIHGNVLLFDPATLTLFAGDGTNGNVIPTGARVRLPNILFDCAVADAAYNNRSQLQTSPAGIIDLECCAWSDNMFFQGNNFLSMRIRQMGCVGRSELRNSPGDVDIENFAVQLDPRQNTQNAWIVSNITGSFKQKNLYSLWHGTAVALSYSTLSDVQLFEGIETLVTTRISAFNVGLSIATINDCLIKKILLIGGRLTCNNANNLRIEDVRSSDRLDGVASTAVGMTPINFSNVSNSILRQVSLPAGAIAPYGDIFYFDASCFNNVFHTFTINGQARTSRLGSADGANTTIARGSCTNTRTAAVLQTATADGNIYRDLVFLSTGSIVGATRQHLELVLAASKSGALSNYSEDGPYSLLRATASTGGLVVGPFGAPGNRGIYTVTNGTLGGNVYFDNAGGVFLETLGNQIIIRNYFPIRGITSFQNAAPVLYGTFTVGQLDLEFRMAIAKQPQAASWQTLNAANLSGALAALTGYIPAIGFDMEIRVTGTVTTSLTRKLSQISMSVNLDPTFVPAIGEIKVTIAGALPDSQVAIFDNTIPAIPVLLGQGVVGTGNLSIGAACNFNDVTTPILIRVRKVGYDPIELTSAYVNSNLEIPVAQNPVKDIAGTAIFGRGSGATASLITIAPASKRIDIGNGRVTAEDLYNVVATWQATATGILYPEALRFNGTDALLLNGWLLRRLGASDRNAGVDANIAVDGSPGGSPDDEVNGSVDIVSRTVRQTSSGAAASSGLSTADINSIALAVRQEIDTNSTALSTLKKRTAAMM